MNKKNVLMTGLAVLSMIMSGAGLAGCSNQTEANPTSQNTKQTKTLGKKTSTSKSLKIINKTSKAITVFETKSSDDDSFGDNLLKDGDSIKKNVKRTLYYEPKKSETLTVKIGLKGDDTTYTFEKVDENLDTAKSFEIKLNDDKKPTISITKKDDSITSIESTKEEAKTNDETKNEEKANETTKVEDTSSETKSDSSTSSDNKTGTTTTTNKNNSSSSSSSPSQHTHNWVAQTKTVHHDAEYSQQYVVDSPAYDEVGHYEKVLIKAAYDETVTTGYKCSTCGATK